MNRNLAARAGRWSAAHWKTATFGWIAFVALAVVLGGVVGTKQLNQNATGPGESGRMAKILDEGFKQPAAETVLVQSRSLTARDPAFRTAIADVTPEARSPPAARARSRPTDTRRSSASTSAAIPTKLPTRSIPCSRRSMTPRRRTVSSRSVSSAPPAPRRTS